MKIELVWHDRFIVKSFLFFLTLLIVLICMSIFNNPTSGLAAIRDKPTPTPNVLNPNGVDIVGGGLANAGEYPWQVALVDSTKSNPYFGQFCGGTLIARQWVLTAGHCVVDNDGFVVGAGTIDVVLGINNLSDGRTYGSSGQRIGVAQIYLFPGFNYGTNDELNKDAALLRLESAAVLNSLVSTIALASPSDTSQVAEGVTATVTGWGASAESGGVYPNALMEVEVPIVSYATCMTGYGGMFNLSNDYHLCAGYLSGGKDSCYGDSGGPLIVHHGAGWLQVGIVSFGEGCARANYYGVYSKVSYFKSWIDATIGVENPVYLPLFVDTTFGTSQSCTPDPAGDSDNISDALIICNGGVVSGTTNYEDDMDDVYKIYISDGKTVTISMTGNGGNSDLYLFSPDKSDVNTDEWYSQSENDSVNEYINEIVDETGYWYVDIYSQAYETTNYQITVTVSD